MCFACVKWLMTLFYFVFQVALTCLKIPKRHLSLINTRITEDSGSDNNPTSTQEDADGKYRISTFEGKTVSYDARSHKEVIDNLLESERGALYVSHQFDLLDIVCMKGENVLNFIKFLSYFVG